MVGFRVPVYCMVPSGYKKSTSILLAVSRSIFLVWLKVKFARLNVWYTSWSFNNSVYAWYSSRLTKDRLI